MTENAVLADAKPARVRSRGTEWATLIVSIVGALAVLINPMWGLLCPDTALRAVRLSGQGWASA